MPETDDVERLVRRIQASAGLAVVRRTRARNFSLCMFTMNARELERGFQIIQAKSLELVSTDDKQELHQLRGEVSRLLHNFLAAAKTLVDHTRVFMRAYYLGSPLEKAYQDKIAAEIANDELCRFVHDLRNYMLHCGAPPLSIWSSLGADRKTQAGVSFIIAPLTEWNGWTAPSKRFLDKQRRDFDVDDVARIYSQKIVSLHVWLDGLLSDCHRSEMSELRALENELASLSKFYRPEADAGAWSNWRDPPKLSGLPWIP
ncbi:MAG TPA: hypothetical protein VNJ49_03285 [Bradyrhizobium sp.]|jgi:hypothetical protein|nr:hypothetical protein [Bradyrhizobium sp.]